MGPPCQLGIFRVGPARRKFTFRPYNRSCIDRACSVKRAVYWPHSFLCVNHNYDKILKADRLSTVLISALIDFDFTSVHNYAKRTWPISSHIGQTLVNTHSTIITIPPMELSSEVEADLAKPTKKNGKVTLCQRLLSFRITLALIHLHRAYIWILNCNIAKMVLFNSQLFALVFKK